MSSGPPSISCKDVAPLLVFYACGECNDQERILVEQHLVSCPACKAQLADEVEFENTLRSLPETSQQPDPSGILLGQCRSELAERLDELEHPRQKEIGGLGWLSRWMGLHPMWSAATLVLFGLVTGAELTQWFTGRSDANGVDAMSVRPSGPRLTEDQLSKMAVAGVDFAPSATNPGVKTVRLQLSAEQPVELSGSLDDVNVRSVLTYVVKNGHRFDSGVRLDCLDALKALAEDDQVREALLAAARRDENPAVRLKALEALRESADDADVRDTLLATLQHDSNPGVRVEAVNLLVRSIGVSPNDTLVVTDPGDFSSPRHNRVRPNSGAPDDDSMQNVIRALEEMQHKDPSRYVRMRSAAALREISARSEQ